MALPADQIVCIGVYVLVCVRTRMRESAAANKTCVLASWDPIHRAPVRVEMTSQRGREGWVGGSEAESTMAA